MQQGGLAFAVIRRESLQPPDRPCLVPMVSVAMGCVCTYLVTDPQGEHATTTQQIGALLPHCNVSE
jgi:hypothetical protein